MTDANKRANIVAELARADDSMRAAHVLVDAGLLHDAESRLYYDYGRNFVLTVDALREDLAQCESFLARARVLTATLL